jgi:hypothetical protein
MEALAQAFARGVRIVGAMVSSGLALLFDLLRLAASCPKSPCFHNGAYRGMQRGAPAWA